MTGEDLFHGGCHCGDVRFSVRIERFEAIDCNCSICTKKGYLHLIVPEESFTLEQGRAAVTTYTFGTGTAKHHFCHRCGIHSFYVPRSHPESIDVNVRCLEDVPLERFVIRSFDGKHWEENVESIR